jgi:hypothetical protein
MASPSDRFKQTLTYSVATAIDANGKPTLSGTSTAPARIQPVQQLSRDARGNEFLSTHVIYTAATLTLEHRVTLPGENTPRRILLVEPQVDGAGVERFRKLVLG